MEMGENELRSRLAEQFDVQRLIEIEPARARKLIRDATVYAAGLGLSAAKDTSAIEAIFGDIDAGASPIPLYSARTASPSSSTGRTTRRHATVPSPKRWKRAVVQKTEVLASRITWSNACPAVPERCLSAKFTDENQPTRLPKDWSPEYAGPFAPGC